MGDLVLDLDLDLDRPPPFLGARIARRGDEAIAEVLVAPLDLQPARYSVCHEASADFAS